jgi:hypothetical protein
MRTCLILCCLLLGIVSLQAQDKIYKKDGQIISAKVTEVGVDEIKYLLYEEITGPVYVIEKMLLIKIVFANGRVETYHHQLKDPSLYADQKKAALKLNFLSPLFGHTLLTYEKSRAPGRSIELSLSIIGLGKNISFDDYYYDPITGLSMDYRRGGAGAAVGFGYKFIKTPDFLNRNIRYAHILQGSYFKPVAYLGTYSENIIRQKNNGIEKDRRTTVYGSLMMEFGKQWVVADRVVLDMFFGVGYGFDNINDEATYNSYSDEYSAYHYTNIKVGKAPALALNTGFRIGILLGQEKSSLSNSSSR